MSIGELLTLYGDKYLEAIWQTLSMTAVAFAFAMLIAIVVMLIMRTGSILNNGFEEVYLLKNALTSDVADIFETYTYEIGLQSDQFSYASAVGLFQSVIAFTLTFITNKISNKLTGYGLW